MCCGWATQALWGFRRGGGECAWLSVAGTRVVSETVLRPRRASLGLATVLLEAEAGGVRHSGRGEGCARVAGG